MVVFGQKQRRGVQFYSAILLLAMRSIRPAAQNQEMNAAASILLHKSIAGGSKRPGSCGIGAMNADMMPRHHIYCQDLLPCSEISGALPASASLVMKIPVPGAQAEVIYSIGGGEGYRDTELRAIERNRVKRTTKTISEPEFCRTGRV